MNDRKFIVMSADALVTEDLELLKTQPNYKRYVDIQCRKMLKELIIGDHSCKFSLVDKN